MKYVAGGVYNEEFLLVKPSGKGALPYVSSNPHGMLMNSTKHHSHFYRVEGNTLFLEYESWEASGVGAPSTVTLLQDQVDEIEKSFNRYDHK